MEKILVKVKQKFWKKTYEVAVARDNKTIRILAARKMLNLNQN